MSVIAPQVLERIQLWGRHLGNRDQWPEWYVWSGGWYENNCEATVYVTWPIDAGSVVFDVGGYEGAWSRKIIEKYDPILHFFEPVPRAFKIAHEHLSGNPKVQFHHYAVGAENLQVTFRDCDRDGAGEYAEGEPTLTLPMRRFSDVLEETGVSRIDLMALNIEGGEYEFLDHLIVSGCLGVIERIMIQWHWRGEGDHERQQALQEHMAQTHKMVWNYGAHEAWEKR